MTAEVIGDLKEIKLKPGSEAEEIIQNVGMIISTGKGSVALDRGLGLDTRLIDIPVKVAQVRLTAEVAQAIKEYEPRAEMKRLEVSGDGLEGGINAEVVIR